VASLVIPAVVRDSVVSAVLTVEAVSVELLVPSSVVATCSVVTGKLPVVDTVGLIVLPSVVIC
jgi:hypothetical protein